jgi:hypothetical protein
MSNSRTDVILSAGGRLNEGTTDLMIFLDSNMSSVGLAVVLNLQGSVLPDGAQVGLVYWCMCVLVYVCVCVYWCMCVCIHSHISLPILTHALSPTHTHTHTYTHTHIQFSFLRACVVFFFNATKEDVKHVHEEGICLYAYMLICLYAYMLICLYAYMLMLNRFI